MSKVDDKLIRCEIIEPESLDRYWHRDYMTRDFFINGRHYNWVGNIKIGDGAVARYGVLQGWPTHEGARRINVEPGVSVSTAKQIRENLASRLDGPNDLPLASPLGYVRLGSGPGKQIERAPDMDGDIYS